MYNSAESFIARNRSTNVTNNSSLFLDVLTLGLMQINPPLTNFRTELLIHNLQVSNVFNFFFVSDAPDKRAY
jgi:hypothetical protein